MRYLALALVAACVFAAEPTVPDLTVAGVPAVILGKSVNVRFGPNAQAKAVAALSDGAPVEVLGVAPGAPDWLTIRFPREGKAWVHERVVTPSGDGKYLTVREDRAKARDDSRILGAIVAELAEGEVLENKGQKIGQWYAVYIPNAVAYVNKKFVKTSGDITTLTKDREAKEAVAEATWTAAQASYANAYALLRQDQAAALRTDWSPLVAQLTLVMSDHHEVPVRIAAARLRDALAKIGTLADQVAAQNGTPVVKQPIPTTVVIKPVALPDQSPVTVDLGGTKVAAPLAPVTSVSAFAAQGFVDQQRFSEVGTNDVLIDGDGNVVAFLKVKDGSAIVLSEFVWRPVGVIGSKELVDQAKHSLKRDIPLIIVEDVKIAR